MHAGSEPRESFGEFCRWRREELGLTLADVAAAVGCARGYLSAMETGARPPPGDEILGRWERALSLPVGRLVRVARWEQSFVAGGPEVKREVSRLAEDRIAAMRLAALLRQSGPGGLDAAFMSGELRRLVDRLSPEDESSIGEALPLTLAREVPLINRVAAGYPREFTDLSFPARIADEYVRCPDVTDPEAFAARVVGDSMLPEYKEGDIVVFSPSCEVRNGMDCFARLEPDHETTFKRVYFEGESGSRIRLQPLNSAYPPRTVDRDMVAGLYAAVSVMRRILH